MAFLGNEEQIRALQERFRFLYLGLLVAALVLLSRLAYLQIINGDKMRQYSEENRIKRVKIPAPRGMIFDRGRQLLVDNRPSFDAEIVPQYLRESGQREVVLKKLGGLIGMTEEQISKRLIKMKGQPAFIPVKIKEGLTRDEVAKIETWKLDMPGVSVEMEIQRTNIYGDVASHLLGYIGTVSPQELKRLNKDGKKYSLDDSVGKDGIEKRHEELLRGYDGRELVEVDALGRIVAARKKTNGFLEASREESAVPGNNLVLTIDQDLQMAAVKAFGDKSGGVVALDPRNGEILAMVSRPSFNPTDFSRGIDPTVWRKLLADENRPLRDKTVQDHYPPGSTFKVVTAIAGLEEGVIDSNTIINCNGAIQVGNRSYHCHKRGGHGPVDVTKAIASSCDVFFYRVAQKLSSVDLIASWAKHLGLGSRTGIPLNREAPGIIPTEAWKQATFNQPWTAGESLSVAIGQSFVTVTVLQLANAYSALVNGGVLYRPHFLKSVETYDGQLMSEFPEVVMGQSHVKASTLEILKQGLWGVVNSTAGTAIGQRMPGMEFAGKTGTIQVVSQKADKIYSKCENLPYRQRHHGMFVGYAPVHNPSIVVAVVGEHICHGGSGVGPIAKEIFRTYLQKYFPEDYNEVAVAERVKKYKLNTLRPLQFAAKAIKSLTPDWPAIPPEKVKVSPSTEDPQRFKRDN